MSRKKYETVFTSLKRIAGISSVSTDYKDLLAHAKDRSFHAAMVPDFVVWPKNTQEVSRILKLANKYKVPVTARGGGSSLEGNALSLYGGIALNMTKMDALVTVYPEDLQVRVEPGVIVDNLNNILRKKYQLFFPIILQSSSIATIGGMIANNAGGRYAMKYGAMGEWILSMEVVLANGEIIRTGNRSFKSVTGYDLTALFVGSEGTLGVITEVTLKLVAVPPAKLSIMLSCRSVSDAVTISLGLLKLDTKPAAIEFIDASYMVFINQAKNLHLPEKPTLIVEFRGVRSSITEQIKAVKSLARKNRVLSYKEFKTEKQNALIVHYRQSVRPIIKKLLPHTGIIFVESGVPVSQISNYLYKIDLLAQKHGLQIVVFGHIGDGTFHCWILYELENIMSQRNAIKLKKDISKLAIKFGGTASAEYGVGIGKRDLVTYEHPTGLPVMKKIKQLFDPNGILNPGKIFAD